MRLQCAHVRAPWLALWRRRRLSLLMTTLLGLGSDGCLLCHPAWPLPLHPSLILPAAVGLDTELFLACDPLTEQAEAAALASRLGMWLHARHDQLFSLG